MSADAAADAGLSSERELAAAVAGGGRPAEPPRRFRLIVTAVIVGAVVCSTLGLQLKWGRLLEAPGDLWTVARLMFTNMTRDDTSHLLQSMWQSIAIAWLGTLLASVFAVPLSFLAAQNVTGRAVGGVVRQLFNLLRSIPEILLAIVMVPIFGLTPLAGMMAIAIGSVGTLAKLSSESVEGIQPGPVEAADAAGATGLQRLRWGILPQVVPEMIAFVLYRFEINIRVSAILGMVGAGGIGTDLSQGLLYKEWGLGGQALIIVVVTTMMVDALSARIRQRLLAGPGRRTEANPDAQVGAELLLNP